MEAKHTLGLWRITHPSVMNGVQIVRDYDYPARSETICTMPLKGKGRTANARLIAAAPDLLAALESIRQEAELAQGEWSGVTADYSPEWTWPLKVIAVKADEAIAKGGA